MTGAKRADKVFFNKSNRSSNEIISISHRILFGIFFLSKNQSNIFILLLYTLIYILCNPKKYKYCKYSEYFTNKTFKKLSFKLSILYKL